MYGRAFLMMAMMTLAGVAQAQNFAALVSPPRFEDHVDPGHTYRNVIDITNSSSDKAVFALKTNDWQLDSQGQTQFSDALAANSCRPWVGLEAAQVTIPAGGKSRFRFEVKVPPDAPDGECRFAIMVEGATESVGGSKVALPVAGRIGVVVYVTVGKGAPVLSFHHPHLITVNGRQVPALDVTNTGNAHGRVEGLIDAVDAGNHHVTLLPVNTPLMPGDTRTIALLPSVPDGSAPPVLLYPVHAKGNLEWGGRSVPVEGTFAP